jgi:hypothetical protein
MDRSVSAWTCTSWNLDTGFNQDVARPAIPSHLNNQAQPTALAGCKKTLSALQTFDGPCVCPNRSTLPQDAKKGDLLTLPTLTAISPSRPESAKTDSLPWDAPCPRQGRRNYRFMRGGWDDPNCAQYSTHPALSAPRRALSRARAFQFPIPPFRGVAKAALNCAHRTSTVSPCAFCEQGGHLAAPSSSFSSRALREHGDRPSYPTSFFSILLDLPP